MKTKKWIIIYFKDGEVYGPIWEMESKIRPTRWANQRHPDPSCTYKIKEVEFFAESYTDAFAKSDEPDTREYDASDAKDYLQIKQEWRDYRLEGDETPPWSGSEAKAMSQERGTKWLHRMAGITIQFSYEDKGQTISIDFTTVLGRIPDTDTWIVRVGGQATDRGEYWWPVQEFLAISGSAEHPVVDDATKKQIALFEDEDGSEAGK